MAQHPHAYLFARTFPEANGSKSPVRSILTCHSVDNETESIMLDVIESAFKGHTVISIVHRFARMEYFDRVAVLNQGRIVEYDMPKALLNRESAFRELFRAYSASR